MRAAVMALVAGVALLWVAAAPAGDAEVPERYMKVDDVKALLDRQEPLTFVDVRPRDQYDLLRIRGALSLPLAELHRRIAEVSRERLVVLY